MRYENHNLDGLGLKRCQVFDMPSILYKYWEAVTDVECPCCEDGIIRWAEAGFVPGYRICDKCGRHFLAQGNVENPTLVRVGSRISKTKVLY